MPIEAATRTTHRTFQVLFAIRRTDKGTSLQDIHDRLGEVVKHPPNVKDIGMIVKRMISLGLAAPSTDVAAWHRPVLTLKGFKTLKACFSAGPDFVSPFKEDFHKTWLNDVILKAVQAWGPEVGTDVLADMLGLSSTSICTALKAAQDKGQVKAVGKGRSTKYSAITKPIPFSLNEDDISDLATMDFSNTKSSGGSEPENFTKKGPATITLEIDGLTMRQANLWAALTGTTVEVFLAGVLQRETERLTKDAKIIVSPMVTTPNMKEVRK